MSLSVIMVASLVIVGGPKKLDPRFVLPITRAPIILAYTLEPMVIMPRNIRSSLRAINYPVTTQAQYTFMDRMPPRGGF